MPTGPAVRQVSKNVRTLVQEGGIAVAFPAGVQQLRIEHDAPLFGISRAGQCFGTLADLDDAFKRFTDGTWCHQPVSLRIRRPRNTLKPLA